MRFSTLHLGSSITYIRGLAAFVLVLLAMIENSRMPVDDPKLIRIDNDP
jgi:hypothetical protein